MQSSTSQANISTFHNGQYSCPIQQHSIRRETELRFNRFKNTYGRHGKATAGDMLRPEFQSSYLYYYFFFDSTAYPRID